MGRRNVFRDQGITPEQIRTWYEVEGQTDAEIARRIGVTDAAVRGYRRTRGIATIGQLARLNRGRSGLLLSEASSVEIAEVYSNMGDRAAAAHFNVSAPTFRAKRRSLGLEAISKTDRATSCEPFTDEQKEVVIGTLLGDGHLRDRGVLSISHSHSQLVYLRHLHSILMPHAKPIFYDDKLLKDAHNVAFSFGFRTVQHPWLKSMRDLFYPVGGRVFPDGVLRHLTHRSLAFWYFDDGHFEDGLPSFALGDITDEAAYQVARLVRERFSLDTYIKPQSTPTCKLLGIRAASADAFCLLIRDFATADMLYKIPVRHWPRGLVPFKLQKTDGEVKLPKALLDRCSEWASLGEAHQSQIIEEVASFWEGHGFPHPQPRPEELYVLSNMEERHVIQEGSIKSRHVGGSACHAFQPHIWKGRSFGSTHSPHDIFHTPDLLRKALRVGLRMGELPTASRLRGLMRLWRRSGVYNFRPSAAKALVDRYCVAGGTIFDPCAGYGGRLLGALLSKARPRYIACEPSTATFTGLLHLHQWVSSFVPEVADRCEVKCSPAEDTEFPTNVAMIFTSPPYWKREVYSDEDTQSSARYPTYEMWLENFWKVVLTKSVKALMPGGWLVVNVDDFDLGGHRYELTQDTVKVMQSLGFGLPEILKYDMAGGGNIEKNHEFVFAWCRGISLVDKNSPTAPINLFACRDCGKVLPEKMLRGGVCLPCLEPKGVLRVCVECEKNFMATRSSNTYCSEACVARAHRRKERIRVPSKTSRIFTCKACNQKWETAELGNFTICPSCKESTEVQARTKTCLYRHCGVSFVDTSSHSSMSYCCPEHRRREKLFRAGVAQDENYFKEPPLKNSSICQDCKVRYVIAGNEKRNLRCPSCREKRRHKTCQQCNTPFVDTSGNNTKRFCEQHQDPRTRTQTV